MHYSDTSFNSCRPVVLPTPSSTWCCSLTTTKVLILSEGVMGESLPPTNICTMNSYLDSYVASLISPLHFFNALIFYI